MLITPSSLNGLFQNFRFDYQKAYDAAPTFVERFSTEVPSTSEVNVYAWMDLIPQVRQWIGERAVRNATTRGFTVPNLTFESTVEVPRAKIEDDQYGLYSPIFSMMGREVKLWREKQVMTAIINGGAAASLCYDGQPFFSANHPKDPDGVLSGVQSNDNALALTAPNLQTVRQTMRAYVGRDNAPLGVLMGKPLLLLGPALEAVAYQLLNAEFIAPTSAIGINAASQMQTNPLRGSMDFIVSPWITSATAWYVLDQGFGIMPFIWQLRQAAQFTVRNRDTDDPVFERDVYQYGARMRGVATYGLWWLAARGNV